MLQTITRTILQGMLALSIITCSALTFAADMDAKLNMANRLITEIDDGLSTIRTGDVSAYNALSKKLTKAAELLKGTTSTQHPDYVPATQKWNALRQMLVSTAQQWQEAQTQTQENTQAQNNGSNDVQTTNGDDILARYQKDVLPTLAADASTEQLTAWAAALQSLRGSQLQADLETLDSGAVNPQNADRVKRWITGGFQRQINERIVRQINARQGSIRDAEMLADMVLAIADDDEMRIYNFAYGENGDNNQNRLAAGVMASQQIMQLGKYFPDLVDANLQGSATVIESAATRFQGMREEAEQTAIRLAAMPKKERPKRPEFLQGIEQELYYRGGYIGSISSKGTVVVDSTDIGSITTDGRVWVRGNDAGSIEPNGEVWLRGNQLGSLEDNGEVWRNGTQVGLVEIADGGDFWVDGNKNGRVEPYSGEWKRAAIIFYFRDMFVDPY